MNEQTPTNRPAIDSSVYDFAPGATADDLQELIEKKLAGLDAMLLMTWGVGGGTFGRVLDASAQDNYLWACSELATEIRELFVCPQ
jgi:hypothetical protein